MEPLGLLGLPKPVGQWDYRNQLGLFGVTGATGTVGATQTTGTVGAAGATLATDNKYLSYIVYNMIFGIRVPDRIGLVLLSIKLYKAKHFTCFS